MVRVSGLSLLMLLVLCHAVGSAVGKTFVIPPGQDFCFSMSGCRSGDSWYKDGNRISGMQLKSPNMMCKARPVDFDDSGSYSCGRSSSTTKQDLIVIEMNQKPTIMDVNGQKIESALAVNENFELGCSFTYTKWYITKQLPLKIKWNYPGFKETENIPIEKTEQDRIKTYDQVTLTSRLNFSVENAPSDALVSCQAIDEEGVVHKQTSINIHVVKPTNSSPSNADIIPSELNHSEPNNSEMNASESTTSESTTSESTTSESTTSESTTSESNLPDSFPYTPHPCLTIVLPSLCVVFLAAGLIFFVVMKRRKNSENETRSSVV